MTGVPPHRRSALPASAVGPDLPRQCGPGAWLWLVAVVAAALAVAASLTLAAGAPEVLTVLERVGRGEAASRLLRGGRIAVAVAACVAMIAAVSSWRRRGAGALREASCAYLLRLTAYAAVAVLVAMALLDSGSRFDERPELAAAFGVLAWLGLLLLVAGVLLWRPRLLAAPASRLGRGLDLAAFTVVAVAVAFELALAILPHLSRSPLLQFDPVLGSAGERHVVETLDRFRLPPHMRFFDGTTNSRGYVDDEPFVAGPDDFVVTVIADSFGVGVVPPRFNFTAVLERRLQAALGGRFHRVAAHNLGVAAADFPEYYHLLVREALPDRPAVVVLCVFVGNDLFRWLRNPGVVSFAVLRNWRTFQLLRRLERLAVERWSERAVPLGPALAGRLARLGSTSDEDELPARPRTLFLDIERQRLEICNTASRATELDYREAAKALRRFRDAAGERVLVVLIPDEFQVNDALWAELMAQAGTPLAYDRTYPQERLLAAGRELGVEMLDLLPALADAQRAGATYRLYDTHWSRLGNATAGDAIADAILRGGRAAALPAELRREPAETP
jgi:hypothetical protein